jgi:hypothetical protein
MIKFFKPPEEIEKAWQEKYERDMREKKHEKNSGNYSSA